jgi:hypothetical protein
MITISDSLKLFPYVINKKITVGYVCIIALFSFYIFKPLPIFMD